MKHCLALLLCILVTGMLPAQDTISESWQAGQFTIATGKQVASIYVDRKEAAVVQKAAALLQEDIFQVTGKRPPLIHSLPTAASHLIIVGTIEACTAIRQLMGGKKLSTDSLQGKWEAYQRTVVTTPFKGIQQALVIAGSDRRGAAYGALELSRLIGVSPWYWWADVPVKKHTSLYIGSTHSLEAPAVKYRGLFINDEAPALSGWSKEKFGGFNHAFYSKVFELMLRLRANYLWPAMWGNAFYDDDSLNIRTAEEYAIVIGTSHHEPLMHAHDEWRRYGNGKWNYDSNETKLKDFWRKGMLRATNEKIVSVGMRGDGDEPMSRETATALLERIVSDQRTIIAETTGKPATETPQLWALYKEVQDYYDKGMRVPDDVTLLLCDDNWGNLRRLPPLNANPRKGGYGIYYHFDYVGGPRNYKWINTNAIPRIWEQMHLAWEYNAREIWIVNVGDIKPMELPISFFLDYAWNPAAIGAADLQRYTNNWCAEQFGRPQAAAIGKLVSAFSKYSAMRKPELLNVPAYSLKYHLEFDEAVFNIGKAMGQAKIIQSKLSPEAQDAYFQLVLHPLSALRNVYSLYLNVARHQYMAARGWGDAHAYGKKAAHYYELDSLLTTQYHALKNGKWNHMMSQSHIGYTYWQQPDANKMPVLQHIPKSDSINHSVYSDSTIFHKKAIIPRNISYPVFYEENGVVSIEADHFSQAINSNNITWTVLPDHGKTGSALTAFPVTAVAQTPGGESPHVDYAFYTYDSGTIKLQCYFSPTLNIFHTQGLRFAVSIDDEAPQIIVLNGEDSDVKTWERWVANNIIIRSSSHTFDRPGRHVLHFWMVDPAVVLQKLVIDLGGVQPSYLGPPETRYQPNQ